MQLEASSRANKNTVRLYWFFVFVPDLHGAGIWQHPLFELVAQSRQRFYHRPPELLQGGRVEKVVRPDYQTDDRSFENLCQVDSPSPAVSFGLPMAKIKVLSVGNQLEIERALTKQERNRILDVADQLLLVGGRS